MPSTVTVPDLWPVVPVIAVNRHPVFPKFIKIVEITDQKLMDIVRRKVKLNQPYVGIFVKKDDENIKEVDLPLLLIMIFLLILLLYSFLLPGAHKVRYLAKSESGKYCPYHLRPDRSILDFSK